MGSVKDLNLIQKPDPNKHGVGRFVFSDRYSVFDWGEMPDQIKDKGKSLCMIGAHFFEKLEEKGYKTHYRGLVESGEVKKLKDIKQPSNTMEVNLVRVIEPGLTGTTYDYSAYENERSNMLIPLEIIYRNSLPAGSSVFKRLAKKELEITELGLTEMPEPGQKLETPLMDVSTKLESTDRYISWQEAAEMVRLSDDELDKIKDTALQINDYITKTANNTGLENEDGKMEFGFDEDRNIILVDVLGTPDECRFTYKGMQVSKEIARIYYRNSEWFNRISEAKKKDNVNWKNLVDKGPDKLPERMAELIAFIYQSFCNEITGRKWFDCPGLEEILKEISTFINK